VKPAPPIAPGFVGASIDYCSITRYNQGTTADPVLASLLSNLAPEGPVLRVGGPGPDALCPDGQPRSVSTTTGAIAALARALHAKLILGINLAAHSQDLARSEVATLLHAIDPRPPYKYVQAFEIGNEPDFFSRYGPYTPASMIQTYFSQYLEDFTRWSQIVRQVARQSSFGIAGPSLGMPGLPWITGPRSRNLNAFINSPARPQYLTFHTYPLVGGDPCPGTGCPSIPNLLADSSSDGPALGLAGFKGVLPSGRVLRVDEMNSVTGGGKPGVSDTFASALWALDTMFEMARAGAAGVNVHTFPGAPYELFSHPPSGGWLVHPEYYGLLAFARAAPAGSRLIAINPDPTAGAEPNVKVWATRGADGKTRIAIINKDLRAHDVVIHGPGLPGAGTATLEQLQGPPTPQVTDCPPDYIPTGLCARAGITLGGETFGAQTTVQPLGDDTATGVLARQAPAGDCGIPRFAQNCLLHVRGSGTTIAIPAGSAAILVGTWVNRDPTVRRRCSRRSCVHARHPGARRLGAKR
jgi:hypothetical protein